MMKYKYIFNPETLQYNLIKQSPKVKIKKILMLSSKIILGAIFINIIFISYFTQPSEAFNQKKNDELKNKCQEISNNLTYIENNLVDLQNKDDNFYRPLLEIDALSPSIRTAGYGGSVHDDNTIKPIESKLITDINNKFDKISSKLYVQSRSFDKLYRIALEKNILKSCIPAIRPISKASYFHISSPFGYRRDPFTHRLKKHDGIDFAAHIGVPIHATGNAKVISINHSHFGYGNQVLLDHGFGYRTRYGHLQKILVKKGETVTRGQVIGLMGSTGRSTGAHVHYEILLNNHPVNPALYYIENLSDDEYEEIIRQSKNK